MTKTHGIVSLLLIMAAIVTALLTTLSESLLAGVFYGLSAIACNLVIIYSYCAKCPCRDHHCGHFFPGKLTVFLPQRESGSYTALDYTLTTLGFLLMLIFPQIFLWKHKILFSIFWILIAAAVIEIQRFVCRACDNRYCILNKNNDIRCD